MDTAQLPLSARWSQLGFDSRFAWLDKVQFYYEQYLKHVTTTLEGWHHHLAMKYSDERDFGKLPHWIQQALKMIVSFLS